MLRHPLVAIVAVFSIGFSSQVFARSGGGQGGHGGVAAGHSGAFAGAVSHSAVRGSVAARGWQRGYSQASTHRGGEFGGYGRGRFGARSFSGGYASSGAYGVAPFGTPTYVASGVFVPGNPTQTPVSPPAIYQIEPSGAAARTARGFINNRRPGIYPVGVSDGAQPNIYVVRVPRG